MARIRSLKPEFWTDRKVVALSFPARLFFQGCWNFALCDRGHLEDDAFALKLKILPADQVDPDAILAEVVGSEMVQRRALPDGRTYLVVPHLGDHNKTDSRWSTRCPYCSAESSGVLAEPPGSSAESPRDSRESAGAHLNSAQGGRRGGEGEGEGGEPAGSPREVADAHPPPSAPDSEPPLKCLSHLHTSNPPRCGACGDARRSHDAWARRQRPAPRPNVTTPCQDHPRYPAGRCPPCEAASVPSPLQRPRRAAVS